MKFRLTVRDNRAAGGGVVSSGSGCQSSTAFEVNVVGTTPFTVPFQMVEKVTAVILRKLLRGMWQEQMRPVSAANVKISLSTDGRINISDGASPAQPMMGQNC